MLRIHNKGDLNKDAFVRLVLSEFSFSSAIFSLTHGFLRSPARYCLRFSIKTAQLEGCHVFSLPGFVG